LAYLRTLPARQLKIDRSFVADLGLSGDAMAVVDAVIRLAHALGLRVVAEGVETERQRDILETLGCDEFQATCSRGRWMPLGWRCGPRGRPAHARSSRSAPRRASPCRSTARSPRRCNSAWRCPGSRARRRASADRLSTMRA